MSRKILHRIAKPVLTAFFLMIAWATSTDDPVELNNLPFSAYANDQSIVLVNESTFAFDSLTLILNGVFSRDTLSLQANEEASIPLAAFRDRNGSGLPPEEAPYILEVFYNGSAQNYTGGYMQTSFE